MNKAKEFLKGLFKQHKRKVVVDSDDDLFSRLWNDPFTFKVILFGSEYGLDSKECCKSKDGTCATIECPHNYRRYGDAIYERYKEFTKE